MAPTTGKKLSRCGRGVLKLTSFKPCPRPGELTEKAGILQDGNKMLQNSPKSNLTSDPASAVSNLNQEKGLKKDLEMVLAKYNYKANPNMPGGFQELTIKQGEKLYVHCKHHSNPHWIKAENLNGEIGYAPANYLMELKSKPTQLPWLENRRLEKEYEKEQQEKKQDVGFGVPKAGDVQQPFKPYVSAYNSQSATQASEYSCELCNKSFNGPQPYRMHMSSKAHKEEVEYQNSIR